MTDQFRTDPDWEDVRFFLALVRHGSLSGAARALGVNHATVSRRVARLEKALGSRLIERRPHGYELTTAGQGALQSAGAMETAARSLPQFGSSEPVGGLVRISATPTLAEAFLIPRLAELRDRHPTLDIELVADQRSVSLSRREADIALRLGRPDDGDLVARRLLVLGFGFYANAQWRERVVAGDEPVFVGFDETGAHIPEAVWLARRFAGRRVAFRANTLLAQAAAACGGHGIVLLPHFLGRATAGLVSVFLSDALPTRELWLLRRRDAVPGSAVRLVRDFLIELFRRERELFGPE